MNRVSLFVKITGHLFFLVLFVFSILFYKERHAFDAAHYLFEIINRKGFYIAHGRLIGFVSQVLPLIGIYAGASLKSLMLLYSCGDVCYYYLLFLVAVYVVRSRTAAVSVLLLVCLAVKFSFYCPVTELLQGLVLLPFLYEALMQMKRFNYNLIPLLLLLIIFSHPLLFILAGFVIIWFVIQQNEIFFSKQHLFLISTFLIITAAKFLVLDKYDYQKSFYPVVFNDYSNVNNVTDFDFIVSFLKVYFKENFLIGILWIITLGILFIKRRNLQLLMVFFAPVAFLLLIIITHRFTAITNYSERMLLPFAGMIILSFSVCIQEVRTVFAKNILYVFIGISLCLRMWIIYEASFLYTKRVAQMEELIRQAHLQNTSKCIVDERNLEYLPYALTGWSYPLESLLLSLLNPKDSSVTIALKEEHYNRFKKRNLATREVYKTQDSIISNSNLNVDYFRLPLTNYKFLNTSCSNQSVVKPTIELQFFNSKFVRSENGFCFIESSIVNQGGVICSNVDSGYQIQLDAISINDSAYRDSRLIPFQIDVINTLKQDVIFNNYGMKGNWKLTVSVVDEHKQTVSAPFIVTVNIK